MKRIVTTLVSVSLALGLGLAGYSTSDGGLTTNGIGSSGCCKQ
jgi:hypothetical protein